MQEGRALSGLAGPENGADGQEYVDDYGDDQGQDDNGSDGHWRCESLLGGDGLWFGPGLGLGFDGISGRYGPFDDDLLSGDAGLFGQTGEDLGVKALSSQQG